jgi:hypothetical protein
MSRCLSGPGNFDPERCLQRQPVLDIRSGRAGQVLGQVFGRVLRTHLQLRHGQANTGFD